jgi:hypothetical protein
VAFQSIIVEAFIFSLLYNDSQLIASDSLNGKYVYPDQAPPKTPYPNAGYALQSPVDYHGVNKNRLFSEYIYQVYIWSKMVGGELQDAARVRKSAHRVDAILDGIRRQSFAIDGTTYYFNVWRDGEIPQRTSPGESADITYKKFGGMFHFQIFT